MSRNTSVTIGEHFSNFVGLKIKEGRFESTSEAVRAGLRLLEADETKLEILRNTLSKGKQQADKGETVDGDAFMDNLISEHE